MTPHKFLEAIRNASGVPIVDIVDATRDELVTAGYPTVGLLGTRATLTERFFRGGLDNAAIVMVVPDERGVAYLDELIFGPLVTGSTTQAMRDEVAANVMGMSARAKLEALVVACTDLMDLVTPTVPIVDPIGWPRSDGDRSGAREGLR